MHSVDAHDTASMACWGSIISLFGDPFTMLIACPALSVTTQAPASQQLTADGVGLLPPRAAEGSISVGADHEPVNVRAWPTASTAIQNDVAGQDTPVKLAVAPCWSGCVHVEPSNAEIPPDTEIQKVASTQEIPEMPPQSPDPRDQPAPW